MAIISPDYYSITKLFPFNRNFILVNSIRGFGKTYGAQAWLIDHWRKTGDEFILICRTQDEKKDGFLEKSLAKVFTKEFPDMEPVFSKGTATVEGSVMCYCVALSESNKFKKIGNLPYVKYILFDEYVIEENSNDRYVGGWDEPEHLLRIYHTVDRDEDRVVCIMLANNISAYNPYHMHRAFRIPYTPPGKIYKSENVIFENALPTAKIKEKKQTSKFGRMIAATDYGKYANEGEYINDKTYLVYPINKNECDYMFTLYYNGVAFGVWRARMDFYFYVSKSINPTCKMQFGVLRTDVTDKVKLWDRAHPLCLSFIKNFRLGNLRFENMEIKKRFIDVLSRI